jgi:hypothetical protein
VDKIYTMEETTRAFERLKASQHFGKVVVEVNREHRPSISGP